ncbi:uncharacterized protein LOC135212082 isoform X4 [Macrobrachium nipponense]|uniref:uncharacterized protein LOC135212082 isoform X4 n=1 Tax=Macrobrachium nipponense TaxID=159736 RepID=UPI0030C830D6
MATNLMKTSDDDDEKREVSLKRGNMDSSGSDHEPGKSSEDASDPVPERRTSARILKLKEKSELEKAMPPSPATKKRRKFGTRFKGKYERVGSEGDREESSQKEKLTLDGKSEHGGTIDAAERGYIIKNNSSPGKVTRTCKFLDPGPIRRVNAPTEGKKYMILNKATIQGMMEKGLIQAIGKDGSDQQNVAFAYRAVLPKTGPTVLRRVPNPNFQGISPHTFIHGKSVGTSLSQDSGTLPATATSASTKLPSSTAPTTGLSSSVTSTSTALDVSSGGLNVQIPTLASAKNSTTGTNPVVTAPVYVKSPIFGSNLSSEKMPVITVPTSVLNHIQKNASLFSVAVTSSSSVATPGQSLISTPKEQSLKSTPKESLIVTSVGKTIKSSEDLDNPDKAADISENENDDADNAKTYGVPTGVCKVLKSMKMYQYINKSEGKSATHLPVKGSQSIRWVAVPNDPNNPEGKSGPQLQLGTPPVLPIVAAIGNDPNRRNLPDTNNILGTHKSRGVIDRYIRYLKNRHEHLLRRYYVRHFHLVRKIQWLKQKVKKVESRCFTPEQLLKESRKYLSDEHVLFFESQMFLKNEKGKGNRYSREFIKLMVGLYRINPSGYKFLKGIFFLPSMKKLEVLQGHRIFVEELPLDTLEPRSVTIEVTEPVEVKPKWSNPEPSFEEFICNLGPDFQIEEPSKIIGTQEVFDCNLKQDDPDPCTIFGLDFNKENLEEESLLRPKFDDGNLLCSKPKFEEGSLFDDVQIFENNIIVPDLLENCTLTPAVSAPGNVLYVSGNPTLIEENIDAPWHETWPYL